MGIKARIERDKQNYYVNINNLLLQNVKSLITASTVDFALQHTKDTWKAIQNSIRLLTQWCVLNGMVVYVEKTKIVKFHF